MSDYKDWIALGANIGNAQWQNRRGDETLSETRRQNNMVNSRQFAQMEANALRDLMNRRDLLYQTLLGGALTPDQRISVQAQLDSLDSAIHYKYGDVTKGGRPFVNVIGRLGEREAKSASNPGQFDGAITNPDTIAGQPAAASQQSPGDEYVAEENGTRFVPGVSAPNYVRTRQDSESIARAAARAKEDYDAIFRVISNVGGVEPQSLWPDASFTAPSRVPASISRSHTPAQTFGPEHPRRKYWQQPE